MAHPYASKGHAHPYDKGRVKKLYEGKVHKYKRGGAVHDDEAEDRKLIRQELKKHDMKSSGEKSKGRMDKYARGGKTKGGKGHHTKINIMVAPKGGPDMPPPGPPMAGPGGPPPGMPPKAPMAPPPGPMAGGMPGIGGKPPGMMKRGGGVRPRSGISSPNNLKEWANYASSNSRYERGGGIKMEHGSLSGEGRLEKIRKYGSKAKKG